MKAGPNHCIPTGRRLRSFPAFLCGLVIAGVGMSTYVFGVMLGFLRIFLDPEGHSLPVIVFIVWYSGVPVVTGVSLILFDLVVLLPGKRFRKQVLWNPVKNTRLTVVLTAFNDEASIALSVQDFLSHRAVKRVVVVENDSNDNTAEVAANAGALVVCEPRRGYGHCVWRALQEGCRFSDTELTLLCEGDMTFRAHDIDKFLAYISHADIVSGTRISEQLRAPQTQLTTFMYYGNFLAGKLLEVKHLGRGTFTDVGTTYKLCRNTATGYLLPLLNPAINLEFNAHFLDTALKNGVAIVECPVTFHARVGTSKGGNVDNWRALRVGMRMLSGILFGWKKRTEAP
jgi:hypothetical protein